MRITLFICFMFSFTSIFSKHPDQSGCFVEYDIDGEQINAHGGCVVYEKELIIGLEKIVQVLNQMG